MTSSSQLTSETLRLGQRAVVDMTGSPFLPVTIADSLSGQFSISLQKAWSIRPVQKVASASRLTGVSFPFIEAPRERGNSTTA
jgi:hypothetical protein